MPQRASPPRKGQPKCRVGRRRQQWRGGTPFGVPTRDQRQNEKAFSSPSHVQEGVLPALWASPCRPQVSLPCPGRLRPGATQALP